METEDRNEAREKLFAALRDNEWRLKQGYRRARNRYESDADYLRAAKNWEGDILVLIALIRQQLLYYGPETPTI